MHNNIGTTSGPRAKPVFSEWGGGLIGAGVHGERGSAPIWGFGGYAPVGFRYKALVEGQGNKVPLNLASILLYW